MNILKKFFKNKKKQKLLVSKKEVEEEIKKEDLKSKGKKNLDDEPNWYHYIIILLVFIGIFYGINFTLELFMTKEDPTTFLTTTFNYPIEQGNITYNIKFNYPIDFIEKNNFTIEPNKIDLLNTINFTRVFYRYNGSDNGKVAIAAIKVRNFLKLVQNIDFIDKPKYFNESNCSNSNLNSKIMIFDINSTRSGVFYNKTNGCVTFESSSANDMILLGDKFILKMIK